MADNCTHEVLAVNGTMSDPPSLDIWCVTCGRSWSNGRHVNLLSSAPERLSGQRVEVA